MSLVMNICQSILMNSSLYSHFSCHFFIVPELFVAQHIVFQARYYISPLAMFHIINSLDILNKGLSLL